MKAVHIDKKSWIENFSVYAHRLGFDEERLPSNERITGAYLIVENEPIGYVTYVELADYWAYIQYGAAFPDVRKSMVVLVGMREVLSELKKKYRLLTTSVENTNKAALKCLMQLGFLIIGFRTIYGYNYVELAWENTK